MSTTKNLRVGIAGLGAVGLEVARRLVDGIDGLTLAAVAVRDADKARRNLPQIGDMIALRTLDTLADDCDIVVECLPPALFRDVAISAIDKGRIFMPLSVAQVLQNGDLIERAKQKGARIIGADRGADRPRRGARRGRRRHPLGEDGDAQAAQRARGRALSGRARHFAKECRQADQGVRGQRARRRQGLPGQCQCRRRVVAGGHRSGQDDAGNLG